MSQTSNIWFNKQPSLISIQQVCQHKSNYFICEVSPLSTAALQMISLNEGSTGNTQTCRQTKWKGESGLMSTVLHPLLSVCSLISSSVSSCVLASHAGPSCYHGDESRHRLSAVISRMLPTGVFLHSPLVIVCVLSFHRESHTPSISLSL